MGMLRSSAAPARRLPDCTLGDDWQCGGRSASTHIFILIICIKLIFLLQFLKFIETQTQTARISWAQD
jgi:hypothetical protein